MSRYFLDTEFNGAGGDLISLALVSASGLREFYAWTRCRNPVPWVAENVLPIIECVTASLSREIEPDQFGHRIASFLYDDRAPVIIADWPDDISYFCKALITAPGEMVSIPHLAFEMIRVDAYPTDLAGAVQHNALWDARALREKLTPKSLPPGVHQP